MRYVSRSGGAQKQYKICLFGEMSVDKVRKEAERLRAEIALGVGDPSAKKAEAKAVPQYSVLAAQHMADAELHTRSWKQMEGLMKKHILPRWGRMYLTDIRSQDIAAWLGTLREQGSAPASVAKIRALFSRSWELGRRWGIPGCDKNPVRDVPQPKFQNARHVYLDREQTARLMAAAAQSLNPQLPAILGLLVLTGARVTELLSARWADVDIPRKLWFVPVTKTNRARHISLSKAAIDIIERIPNKSVWLFPNPKNPEKRLTTIKHSFQTARALANLNSVRIHDLRHTNASAMASAGVDLLTIGAQLGHRSYQSTARYSHLYGSTLSNAAEACAANIGWT